MIHYLFSGYFETLKLILPAFLFVYSRIINLEKDN